MFGKNMKKLVGLCIVGMFLLGGCVIPIPSLRCLVSPIRGELKVGDAPASHIKIVRRYYSHWYEKKIEDSTYTDSGGRFQFAGVWKPAAVTLLHQPVIEIEVLAEYGNDKPILLFGVTKMEYSRLGELDKYAGMGKTGVALAIAKDGNIELSATIPDSPKN